MLECGREWQNRCLNIVHGYYLVGGKRDILRVAQSDGCACDDPVGCGITIGGLAGSISIGALWRAAPMLRVPSIWTAIGRQSLPAG
jgi:hypothetical protein